MNKDHEGREITVAEASSIRCEQRDDGSIEIFVNDVVRGRYAGWKELAMHLGFCIAARDAIATAKDGLDPDIT